MLKQRVITALVLVAVLLLALLHPKPVYWQLFVSVAVLAGFLEWLRFCQLRSIPQQSLSVAAFIAVSFGLQLNYVPIAAVIVISCLLWLVLLGFTITGRLSVIHRTFLKLPIGILILSSAAWLIVEFKKMDNGVLWIVFFLVAVFAADIGAYFVGRRFGKTKLAPKISPGKTVEGLLGGLLLVLVIFTPFLFMRYPAPAAALFLVTVVITALVSVGGDLFESTLKRHVDLKDSGNLLPGHGGVLDRIDSLLAGAPFFSAGLLMMGYLG